MRSRHLAGLAFVCAPAAALSLASAVAEAPAHAHVGRLWIVLGWLSDKLALPATAIGLGLLVFLVARRFVARRRRASALAAPPPARHAPYALPSRVAVALAAAARARQ